MRTLHYKTDVCVVGGGISGLCAALAAARHGVNVILVQDRAVLGGNSSSEIRMHVCGSWGRDNRETGIVEEIFLENFHYNPDSKFPLWDATLYSIAISQKNLTMLLNSSCMDAEMDGNRIKEITAWQSNAETFHKITATYFIDCSGDSILAPLSGAAFRYGREAKSEFNESIPPDVADKKTMGMSCIFSIRECTEKKEFTPPPWAYVFETDDDLPFKDHHTNTNFWWIEVGGEWDCIHDTDRCREECLKICYGVWDHMKNRGDHGVDNWELEWVGLLPGKRESRRYVGKYTVNQNDVEAEGRFDDLVAYAGWAMDDHFPAGFYYRDGYPTIYHPAPQPWGLPLRCMISENIENLLFAGRNISVTHAALSSSRVAATCGVLGQAIGTAAALALHTGVSVENVDIRLLQKQLMDDDCYLPWHTREVSPICAAAKCSAPVVIDGHDRGDEHMWVGKPGDSISYEFKEPVSVSKVRLVFDSNLNRDIKNMPYVFPLNGPKFQTPETLIRDYEIELVTEDGKKICIEKKNNYQRFVVLDLLAPEYADQMSDAPRIVSARLIPKSTYGCESFNVYDFELI